jgi:NADPH-dependent ferric siderophore reductase
VVRTERVTPNMIRVTLGGGDLSEFVYQGFDHWMRLIFPEGGTAPLNALPGGLDLTDYRTHLGLAPGARPAIRGYTVREWRPERTEMDVEFVQHGSAGVAGPWAAAARPGDAIGLIDRGRQFTPGPGAIQVMVADHSALPAVAASVRDLPRGARGHVIVELGDPADRQPLAPPPGVAVHWLTTGPGANPGDQALETLRGLTLPPGPVTALCVGESGMALAARRHLTAERGLAATDVMGRGYFKRGQVNT